MHKQLSQDLFTRQVDGIPSELFEKRRWRLLSREYPIFEVAFAAPGRSTMVVRMNCDDWNEKPPSIELLDAEGKHLETLPTGPTNVFNSSKHNITQRPFICMAGSREYHTHQSHIGDSWEGYKNRSGFTLPEILTQVWDAWLKSQS